jgi:AmmeMemoRadiSam system protein A
MRAKNIPINNISMDFSQKERILQLSRRVLENELYHSNHDLSQFALPEFQKKGGLFVSIHIKENLRGCIGRLEARNSLYQNVIDLSKAAAFEDHRFKNLTSEELAQIKIEISVLSEPVFLEGVTSVEKVMKIRPGIDGVIIASGHNNATFLPQVWESVPIREDFVSELCRKAGLVPDYWMNYDLDISVYQVEHFEEE